VKILKILYTPFILLEYENKVAQIAGATMIAVPGSFMAWLMTVIKINVFSDIPFVEALFMLLLLDLSTGVWKHLKLKTFDWRRLYVGLLEKVFISFMGMIVFNIAGNVKELTEVDSLKTYLLLIGKLTNIFYVGGSAFNNMFIITGGKFPPVGWMERMKKFNQTASISALNEEKNEDSNCDNDKPSAE